MDLVDFSNLLLRSVMSPSITSFCILVLFVLQLAFSRFRDESHLNTQFRVALIFSIVGLLGLCFLEIFVVVDNGIWCQVTEQ